MAIISIPKKEIEKFTKINDELIEKINLFGTPVEEIKEDIIEIEVLPNRPDMFSIQGFLRSFKSYLGIEKGLKKYNIEKPKENYKVIIDSSLKDIRPYTACAIVKNLRFNDEIIKQIIDLQEKLHSTLGRNRKKMAIGIYPLEKINLPIKFEARKPENINFIPLEENKIMNGLEILQKNHTGREYAHLLSNLEKFPVFVDSSNKILSMPPIINSNETGRVTQETKEVFIECSGFDFNLLKKTLNIITTTLADLGGKIYGIELDYGKKEITPNLDPQELYVNFNNVNKLIGLNLKDNEIIELMSRMGYSYDGKKVFAPAWRTDILHEVDVIEDIAIAYGYDKLDPEIPKVATIGEESEYGKFKSKITEILIGLGLIEILTYHLVKENEKEENAIEVENSRTEYKFLRQNLIIPSLRILSENKHNEYPQKMFEIGTIFNKVENEIIEKEELVILSSHSNANFTEAKQILEVILDNLGLRYEITENTNNYFIEGRNGKILINDKIIALIGELHPRIITKFSLEKPVSLLQIDMDKLYSILK